jgi:hypothetical protein
MSIYSKTQERLYTETFENVMALYTALIDDEYMLRVKRAEIRQDGEVAAEPLDFLIDVQLKIRRALPAFESMVYVRMADAGNYGLASPDQKLALGQVFLEFGLGVDGAYRKLYHRTKNNQVRQALKAVLRKPLEETNGRCIE